MDLQLTGKRALVTGSSSGIGAAIAKSLAAEGAAIAIHGRDQARAERVVGEIEEAGGRAVCVLGDLPDGDQAGKISDRTKALLGGVDILVNSAGRSGEKKLWAATTTEDWAELYNGNVLSIVRMVNHQVPLRREKGWGRIVNISSGAGTLPAVTGADYSAAKAAVNNLTVSLSKEVGKNGVTVNAVSPGPILTPKSESVFRHMAGAKGWADEQAAWPEVEQAVIEHAFSMSLPSRRPSGRVRLGCHFFVQPVGRVHHRRQPAH